MRENILLLGKGAEIPTTNSLAENTRMLRIDNMDKDSFCGSLIHSEILIVHSISAYCCVFIELSNFQKVNNSVSKMSPIMCGLIYAPVDKKQNKTKTFITWITNSTVMNI